MAAIPGTQKQHSWGCPETVLLQFGGGTGKTGQGPGGRGIVADNLQNLMMTERHTWEAMPRGKQRKSNNLRTGSGTCTSDDSFSIKRWEGGRGRGAAEELIRRDHGAYTDHGQLHLADKGHDQDR